MNGIKGYIGSAIRDFDCLGQASCATVNLFRNSLRIRTEKRACELRSAHGSARGGLVVRERPLLNEAKLGAKDARNDQRHVIVLFRASGKGVGRCDHAFNQIAAR